MQLIGNLCIVKCAIMMSAWMSIKRKHNEKVLVEILNRIMKSVIQAALERSQVYRLF